MNTAEYRNAVQWGLACGLVRVPEVRSEPVFVVGTPPPEPAVPRPVVRVQGRCAWCGRKLQTGRAHHCKAKGRTP